MATRHSRRAARIRRHRRLRKRVHGTPETPRLCVFRSSRYIYAQLVDDESGRTLAAASDLEPAVRDDGGPTKTERASAVGTLIAQRAQGGGLRTVVFDRGGFDYAGRGRARAEAARPAGWGV